MVVTPAAAVFQDADTDDDHTIFAVSNTKLSFTNTVGRAVIIIELGHQKFRIWKYPFLYVLPNMIHRGNAAAIL
jgi:hypothetical protein